MSDLDALRDLLPHHRFAGQVVRIGPQFGFVRIDGSSLEVFFHREVCSEVIPWENLYVGDRLRFVVRESKHHPGKLVAGRVSREMKT